MFGTATLFTFTEPDERQRARFCEGLRKLGFIVEQEGYEVRIRASPDRPEGWWRDLLSEALVPSGVPLRKLRGRLLR